MPDQSSKAKQSTSWTYIYYVLLSHVIQPNLSRLLLKEFPSNTRTSFTSYPARPRQGKAGPSNVVRTDRTLPLTRNACFKTKVGEAGGNMGRPARLRNCSLHPPTNQPTNGGTDENGKDLGKERKEKRLCVEPWFLCLLGRAKRCLFFCRVMCTGYRRM